MVWLTAIAAIVIAFLIPLVSRTRVSAAVVTSRAINGMVTTQRERETGVQIPAAIALLRESPTASEAGSAAQPSANTSPRPAAPSVAVAPDTAPPANSYLDPNDPSLLGGDNSASPDFSFQSMVQRSCPYCSGALPAPPGHVAPNIATP